MNRIEEEWHQLKTHEIAGRMFEYDLAIAVILRKHAVNKVDTHWNVLSLILASYLSHFWSGLTGTYIENHQVSSHTVEGPHKGAENPNRLECRGSSVENLLNVRIYIQGIWRLPGYRTDV